MKLTFNVLVFSHQFARKGAEWSDPHPVCLGQFHFTLSVLPIINSAFFFTHCLSLEDKSYGHHRLEQSLDIVRPKEGSRPICPYAQQKRPIPGCVVSVQSQKCLSLLLSTWVTVSPPFPSSLLPLPLPKAKTNFISPRISPVPINLVKVHEASHNSWSFRWVPGWRGEEKLRFPGTP